MFKFNTIRKRLTFWLLFVALIPLLIALVSVYIQRVNEINTDAYDKLTTIRNLKVQQVNTWINNRINEVHFIAEGMELRALEKITFNGKLLPEAQVKIEAAQKLLSRNLYDFNNFDEISYLDAKTGIIVISTQTEFVGQNEYKNPFFTEPLKTGVIFIKDIHHSKLTNEHEMTLSIPVRCLSHNTDIIGILMVRINLSKSLYPLLSNREGLGETGETLIVNKEGFALNELRWYENAPLNLKIKAAPALLAVGGETGIIQDLDYRGELVLAAYTYIPQTAWGFVCKQDMYELRAPIRTRLRNFVLIFIFITILGFILAWFIGKSVAKPIVAIHRVAQKIKSGDFSIRNTVDTNDELGLLAQEFNNMTDFTESKIIIQRGVSEISEIIISKTSMLGFGKSIIKGLMKITDANMAVFYVLDEEHGVFEPFTSIGANEELLKPFNAAYPEGEFGNALNKKDIYYLHNIPENTLFKFHTSAGVFIPKEIITIPILSENSVVALISLANINPFASTSYDIIKQSWLSINTAYSSLLSNERTSILAENLARMNYQLEAQSEELRSSTEELYDQNIELDKQKRKVEDANRLKSEFLSNMSHELRTPLNSINALSQVLISQTKNKLNADENNYLKIIERNGKSLLSLINDILDLSRIEAGKMDIEPKPVSLNSALSVIKEILMTLADKKGIDIILKIPDALPWIESDEMRLHQVLLNVASNAVKFTEKGTITIEALPNDDDILIRVADTGIGISEEMLPHIFDEFRQVDGSSSRNYEGTGLGLTIAYKLIKILGGDISVTSKFGEGSIFIIKVPLKWYDANRVTTSKPNAVIDAKRSKNTILVIEDNDKIAIEIAAYLTEAGFDTQIAHTGSEALVLANKHSFYAITLDIYMPETDGWEVLQKLKANQTTKDIPVIIISIADDSSTGFAMGAVGYVSKPVKKEVLLAEISKLNKSTDSIMIVEDNDFELKEMVNFLKSDGIEILEAHNGMECLNLLQKKVPDLIILDLLMPVMDGFEVLHEIRKRQTTQNIPVIIVTAKDLTVFDKELLVDKVSTIISKANESLPNLYNEIKRILNLLDTSQKSNTKPIRKQIVKKPTLLVVEDNMDNMTTFKALLNESYTILEAFDGEQGLKMAHEFLPDLVLLDMSLPKMDGEEVVKLLKENAATKNIPVLAVSARVMKGDKERFLKAGCDDFVPKPINAEELLQKIIKLLGYKN